MDLFINECLNSLAFKERETSDFLIRLFNELLVNNSVTNSSDSPAGGSVSSSNYPQATYVNEFASENHYLNNNNCFNNLIQFELQPFDDDVKVGFPLTQSAHFGPFHSSTGISSKEFGFNFKKENIKYLRGDYAKWLSKMNDLEELMKTMIVQINAKRFGGEANTEDSAEPGITNRVRSWKSLLWRVSR